MSINRDLSTPENREYWKFVAETAKEVAAWPAWKRGERERLTMSISDEELRWYVANIVEDPCKSMARELLAAREAIKEAWHTNGETDKLRAYFATYGESGGADA